MASVQCPSCGREISDQDKVCMYCGFRLRKYCPKCGTELSLNALFCSKCGASVAAKEDERQPLQMPDTIAVMGPQQTAQRGLTWHAVPGQQVSQQASGYERQARLAQETIERQAARQQMQQASDYQQQMQNAQEAAGRQRTGQQMQQANDYQQQVQTAKEATDRQQAQQQMQQQANDYQQQVKNAQEAIDQPRQQMRQQAADYQHQTEAAEQAMEQVSGQHVSHSATVGARRAAKLGGETAKVAAKQVSRSFGNMIGLKIAAIATAATVAVGGISYGGVALVRHSIGNRNRPAQEETVTEQQIVAESAPGSGQTVPLPDQTAPLEEIDPVSFDPEAKDFLATFCAAPSYSNRRGSREFDAANPDSAILSSIVVSWQDPCVDLGLYPGRGRTIHTDEPDPRNQWYQTRYGWQYAEYDAQEVDWVMEHIFHIQQDRIDGIRREGESTGTLYRDTNGGKEYYYSEYYLDWAVEQAGTEDSYEIDIESVKTDGEKYYVTYRCYRTDHVLYFHTYIGDFYAVIADEEIDGKPYWTMYYHTADVPYDSEPAQDLFSRIAGDHVFVGTGGAWGETQEGLPVRTVGSQMQLHIESDGSFYYIYDEKEETYGEAYQYVRDYAEYYGTFINPRKINAYTYAFEVGEVTNVAVTGGVIEHYDGDEYVSAVDLIGMEPGEVFYVYLPDTPQDELPDGFMEWARNGIDQYSEYSETLGFTVIYDEDPQVGFMEQ